MTEMVERVRKAIEAHCCEVGFKLRKDAGNLLARAAIEAMREPNFEMVQAGLDSDPQILGQPMFVKQLKDAYRAMIDAALGEGK